MKEGKKSIWHDASEMPERDEDILVEMQNSVLDNENNIKMESETNLFSGFFVSKKCWNDFVLGLSVKRWCYYSDFLKRYEKDNV